MGDIYYTLIKLEEFKMTIDLSRLQDDFERVLGFMEIWTGITLLKSGAAIR